MSDTADEVRQEQDYAGGTIPIGAEIGSNRVVALFGETSIGKFYKVLYGTTARAYGLLVMDPARSVPFESAKGLLEELSSIHHPCVSKPYEFGFSNGVGWIRTELSQGPSIFNFDLPATLRRRIEEIDDFDDRVSNVAALLSACDGALPQNIFCRIAADLLEGLEEVHANGFAVGPFTYDNILIQKNSGKPRYIAKWIGYGYRMMQISPEARGTTSMSIQEDVVSAGELLKRLLLGDEGGDFASRRDLWREWAEFFAVAEGSRDGAGFLSAKEMREAFNAILSGHDAMVPPRKFVPAEEIWASEAAEKTHHSHRSRRRHSKREGTRVMTALGPLFRMIGFGALLAGLGILGYWIASGDVRAIKKKAAEGERAHSSTNLVTSAGGVVTRAIPVWMLSDEELRIKSDTGDDDARMCLAFRMVRDKSAAETNMPEAVALASVAYKSLERAYASNGTLESTDSLFWLAYAKLAGLGTERDISGGMALMEDVAPRYPYAMAILADYKAFSPYIDHTAQTDRRAVEGWRYAADNLPRNNKIVADCVEKVTMFVLADRGLPKGSPEELVAWMQGWTGPASANRHVSTIVALGRIYSDGALVKKNPVEAMNYFRRAAILGNAEGMRRMAWMFEKGQGVPQSSDSAAIWFERAANDGDVEAMIALSSLLRKGIGDAGSDAAAADRWLDKANELKAQGKKNKDKDFMNAWWRPDPSRAIKPAPQEGAK